MELRKELKDQFSAVGLVVLMLVLASQLLAMPYLWVSNMMWRWGSVIPFTVTQLVNGGIYMVASLAAVVSGCLLFKKRSEFLIPIKQSNKEFMVPAVFAGISLALLSNMVANIATISLNQVGVMPSYQQPIFGDGAFNIILTIITYTILPAIFEEAIFRGVLLQPLRKYGNMFAMIVSSLVFASCHGTLPQFITAFLTGMVLSLFVVRTGSLVTSMLIHLSYNTVAIISTLLSGSLFTSASDQSILVYLTMAMGAILICVGLIHLYRLRKKFGPIWWVPKQTTYAVTGKEAVKSAVSSIPFLAAMAIGGYTIVSSITMGLR